MAIQSKIGRPLFAIVFVAFGVQCLIFSKFIGGLEPLPAALVPAVPWAWVTGAVLIGAGLSLFVERTARAGALLLAGLLFLSTILLHGPLLIARLKNDADAAFHTLAIGAAALVLAAGIRQSWTAERPWDRLVLRGGRLGQVCFGLCTVGHGAMHFVFFRFTADFIPAWIPQHEFWAAATGVAQIAAGLAILSAVLARLAATLAAVMYGSWVLIVHLPRVMAQPTSHTEWNSLVVATALCASGLLVAGAMGAHCQTAADPAMAKP
jgi:uncharacterized membrane protein YphA (DoxX/SURF4 family)